MADNKIIFTTPNPTIIDHAEIGGGAAPSNWFKTGVYMANNKLAEPKNQAPTKNLLSKILMRHKFLLKLLQQKTFWIIRQNFYNFFFA